MRKRWIKIEHEKVGAFRIQAHEILRFDGIPGFPDARRFALLAHDRGGQVAWLACCDDPALALPVVNLRALRPDVCEALTPDELAAVSAEDASCVDLFGIVNLRHAPPRLNLEAPLLVHGQTRRGVQLIRERALDLGAYQIGGGRPDSDRVESPDIEGPGEQSG